MIGLLWSLLGCGSSAPVEVIIEGPDGVEEIKPCSSGCARPEHPVHAEHEEIEAWLREFGSIPLGTESLATDSLLFHGHETHAFLEHHGHEGISDAHLAWLQRELARDHVDVSFRLVAEDGRLLGHHEDRFPWVEHQDFVLSDTGALGRISMNGKVKRTGPHHLWARF